VSTVEPKLLDPANPIPSYNRDELDQVTPSYESPTLTKPTFHIVWDRDNGEPTI